MVVSLLNLLGEWAEEVGVYVVGGAVRDMMSQTLTSDHDLLLPEEGFMEYVSQLTKILGLSPYVMNAEHRLWRFERSGQTVIDVSPLKEDLISNLRSRDFTINSMALSLSDYLAGYHDKVIDPCGGLIDLEQKKLVPSHSDALRQDCVRILRGVRLMAERGFTASEEFVKSAYDNHRLLRKAPGERVWAELSRILNSSSAPQMFQWLDKAGVQAVLFPELELEKNVEQNRYHSFCVYEHSERAFAAYVRLWDDPFCLHEDLQEPVIAELNDMKTDLRAVCRLGALLHDIGKPGAKAYKDDGRVTFHRHEQIGADMIPHVASRLRLSSVEGKSLYRFVRMHTYLAQLARLPRMTDGHIHRIARRLGVLSAPIALFNIADLLAKGEDMTKDKSYAQMCEAVNRFFVAWYHRRQEVIDPSLPINGEDLAVQLGIPPGRWLSDTLSHLLEMRASGRELNREQALHEAREFVYKRKK